MNETNWIDGSCICGKTAFRVEDDLKTFKLCFCSFCQKASGSAHVSNGFALPEQIEWTRGEDDLRVFDVPNSFVRRVFCSTCGTSLPFITQNGSFVVVPVGSLSRPPKMTPQKIASFESRPAWYDAAMTLVAAELHTETTGHEGTQ
ncbi:MAG: GFA family protein [Paracoccaceae bacterium]